MNHIKLLILPGLLDATGGSTFVTSRRPMLDGIELETTAERIFPTGIDAQNIVAAVGLNPRLFPLAEGPLAIAALNLEPPIRSTLFALTLMGIDTDELVSTPEPPTSDEARWLEAKLPSLNSSQLTVCIRSGLDHALVWNPGSLDLATSNPAETQGKPWRKFLPEGDGEPMLRRFIDDSVNLLMGSEMNRRRIGEGKTPIGIAWPWGQGMRQSLPNLALQLGQPATITSSLPTMQGVANLTRCQFRQLNHPFKGNWSFSDLNGIQILVTDVFQQIRDAGRLERGEELWESVRSQVIVPCLNTKSDERQRLSVIAPNADGIGLAVHWDSHFRQGDGVPLHERALFDDALPQRHLWEIVRNKLQSP